MGSCKETGRFILYNRDIDPLFGTVIRGTFKLRLVGLFGWTSRLILFNGASFHVAFTATLHSRYREGFDKSKGCSVPHQQSLLLFQPLFILHHLLFLLAERFMYLVFLPLPQELGVFLGVPFHSEKLVLLQVQRWRSVITMLLKQSHEYPRSTQYNTVL